jgi:PTH1 family peptidyl-tRNA hydrolase
MDQTLIIGLGNPDPLLEETYHNVGVLAVQWLAEHGESGEASARFRRHGDLFEYVKIDKKIFMRPLVFMNESGKAVREAMRAFGMTPHDILVIHDDSDLPMGEWKLSKAGRAAGHKGIQSIIDHLKEEEFSRVRIGIREKGEVHRKKAGDFVLSPIAEKDRKTFEHIFEEISAKLFYHSEDPSGNVIEKV